MRAPPLHRLPPRRADLRRQPLPATPEPGRRLSHPQGGGAQPPAAIRAGPQAARHLQGLRGRLRACRREALAQAAGSRPRLAQTLPVRRHRPRLTLRAPRRQRRRDHGLSRGLPHRGARCFSVPSHACADRPRLLLHSRCVRGCLRAARCAASQDAPLHAKDQRHGRALQRPCAARSTGHHALQPPRSGDRAARLQRGLQPPATTCAQRALARDGPAPAPRSRSDAGQSNLQATQSQHHQTSNAHRRRRQGGIATRHLPMRRLHRRHRH